jgi:hypothetical protein
LGELFGRTAVPQSRMIRQKLLNRVLECVSCTVTPRSTAASLSCRYFASAMRAAELEILASALRDGKTAWRVAGERFGPVFARDFGSPDGTILAVFSHLPGER